MRMLRLARSRFSLAQRALQLAELPPRRLLAPLQVLDPSLLQSAGGDVVSDVPNLTPHLPLLLAIMVGR